MRLAMQSAVQRRRAVRTHAAVKNLPKRLTHDIMIPLGPHAFTPGKLVHTNEVRVLLGDDIYCDRTAFQAKAIVRRRSKRLL